VADLRWILVLSQPHKFESDIEGEKGGDGVFNPEKIVVADIKFNGSEVHRREARVGDDDEHETVPKVEERVFRTPLELVSARLLLFLPARPAQAIAFVILILLALGGAAVFALMVAIHLCLHVCRTVDEHRLVVFDALLLRSLVSEGLRDWVQVRANHRPSARSLCRKLP